MPRRKKYKKKKRRYQLQVRKSPMPHRFFTKLRYFQTVFVNPGVGTAAVHVMRINSLADPDYTGTGHQPRGYDELGALYRHYTVLGAKARCYFTAVDSAAQHTCFLSLEGASNIRTAAEDYMEQGSVSSRVLGGTNSQGGVTLTKNYSTKRFFGTKDVLDNSQYRALIAGNPADIAYLHIGAFPSDETTNTSTVSVNVIIDFIVAFTEPAVLNAS